MIREIVRPESRQLVIDIPRDYLFKPVEVLVFPISDESRLPPKNSSDKLAEFKKLMDEANEANIRVSDDVDIDALMRFT